MTRRPWLLYGAYGYTGRLLAREAAARGHRPLLAGRDPERLAAVAHSLDLPHRPLSLDDPSRLRKTLEEVDLVLHAAGPFIRTAPPMVEACLEAGTHYLDITGEVAVLEEILERDREARERGVVLLPAVGFDVVATDCLAVHVARRCPDAHRLELAFSSPGGASAGTLKTMLEHLPGGGRIRRNGELREVRLGSMTRTIPFPDRSRIGVAIPWGDLATAWRSTGIPDLTVYMAVTPAQARIIRWTAPLVRTLLGPRPVRTAVQKMVDGLVQGPDSHRRERARSRIWARAEARIRSSTGAGTEPSRGDSPDEPTGNASAEASLETAEGYRFTALAGIRGVEAVLGSDTPAPELRGALTPAQAFGPDFVLSIPGTRRNDAP